MSKPVLDNLFGSKTRVKLLKFMFRNYPADFTAGEIARRIQESPVVTKQEILLLKTIGLIKRK